MNDGAQKRNLQRGLLYGLAFILLWEWLRPLNDITDTGNLGYFVVFILLSMTLYYLNWNKFLSFAIKLVFIVYSLYHLYADDTFMHPVAAMIADLWDNIGLTIGREWSMLSDMYRSLLFFILLWLMTYLIHYWLSVRKTMLLFYIMTIIYISLLDTFTSFDAKGAIIRVIILGFLLLGMLALLRLKDQESLKGARLAAGRWMIPLVLMIGASSVLAFAAPKIDPVWPDPVPYLKAFADEGNGSGGSKLGYGEDDSKLGGPFLGDPKTVFTADVVREHYWRIESKDIYTGSGWERTGSEETEQSIPFNAGEEIPLVLTEPDPEKEPDSEVVKVKEQYSHVVYPYGINTFQGNENGYFSVSPDTQKITTLQGEEEVKLEEYVVEYTNPVYSLKGLESASADTLPEGSQAFLERYTQLPENLPERVGELARTITADKENWYQKAKAIEEYFEKENFVYEQFDVPVPEEGQDYVDQFLFETQMGYCDNFSTSMVVLVRSLGIPARWAKGYTEGEYQRTIDTQYKTYKVTNNNAHSWVEVFFPGEGWVPFEPTVGFTGSSIVNYDYELPETEETVVPPIEQEKPEKDMTPEEEDSGSAGSASFSIKALWDDAVTFAEENWGKILLAVLVLGLIAYSIFRVRRRWLPYLIVPYYKFKNDDEAFPQAYVSLLRQLKRYGLKMDDGQTLRSYSRYVDSFFGTREMTSLTDKYERTLYGQKLTEHDWKQLRELWENLIKRTTG
ncbi:transglutaminaseTgpA domain-containing protein [Bacillus salacetis]|uniref:transglutaminaseTgpA domain-containing protein n=1 Tax=Bacillus salacetis TaxID=2315464 RepID=UPI003B9EF90F